MLFYSQYTKETNFHCMLLKIVIEGHHHRVLPKGRSFTANSGTKAAILPKDRSSIANSGS